MNVITIAGQLGRAAEVKHLNSGDAICNFSIADSMGKDKGTIWWNCSLFGKRAESLAPYLVKGQAVTVSGTVSEREWTDKDGAKRKSMDVRVNDVALQGGRRDSDEPRQEARERVVEPIVDEDLPF
jgi:single-strand DNA-binding protein